MLPGGQADVAPEFTLAAGVKYILGLSTTMSSSQEITVNNTDGKYLNSVKG